MKKSLLTVITFVLVLINLGLTGVLTFVLVPYVSSANKLVSSVATAIELEQKAGAAQEQSGNSASTYPIDQIEVYDLNKEADDKGMTINLKKGADGKDHYAVIKVNLSINKESEVYSKYYETLDTKKSLIQTEINNVVSQYTVDEIRENQQAVQDEILKRLQSMFGEDFIVGVGFSSATYQ
ncbi:MAG: flagellar basal body-associated FliL family protein [Lachnospiraceae bacterium]|nr:flagellar basal body-associated FliL family protein [Lachnospiraceae bacterium]